MKLIVGLGNPGDEYKNTRHNIGFMVVDNYLNNDNNFIININDILIISDDLDMPCFKIKLKYKGSSGGHNGLKNISENLHTEEFKRLKIGISNDKTIDTKTYVLSKFNKEELELLNKKLEVTKNIINDFVEMDFEKLMSKYNE